MQEIKNFKNKEQGKKGFVVASGPSLNLLQQDFPCHSPVIVCNEAALKIPWAEYAITLDSGNYQYLWQLQAHCRNGVIPHIFTNKIDPSNESTSSVYLHTLPGYNYRFSLDASKCVFDIGTPAYAALQLALYFGWSETYLLGVDYLPDPDTGDSHYWGNKTGYFDEDEMVEQFHRSATVFIHKLKDLKELGYNIYSCSPYSRLNCIVPYIPLEEALINITKE